MDSLQGYKVMANRKMVHGINKQITWYKVGEIGCEPPNGIRLLLAYKVRVLGEDEWAFCIGIHETYRENNLWEGKSRIHGNSRMVKRWNIGEQKNVRPPEYWAEIVSPDEIEG